MCISMLAGCLMDSGVLSFVFCQGVLSNKSNMVQVYAHDDNYPQPDWAKAALQSVIGSQVSREQLVCMANLGLCRSKEHLRSQLERALELTGLDVMDICTFRV